MDKLLKGWPAVVRYFKSIDAPALHKLLKIKDGDNDHSSVVEIVLYFAASIITVFNEAVLSVEGDKTSATEVFKQMSKLRNKLIQRKNENFFGFTTGLKLNNSDMPAVTKQRITAQFVSFYIKSISYLEKAFDFSDNNILAILSPMALEKDLPSFAQLITIINALQ